MCAYLSSTTVTFLVLCKRCYNLKHLQDHKLLFSVTKRTRSPEKDGIVPTVAVWDHVRKQRHRKNKARDKLYEILQE